MPFGKAVEGGMARRADRADDVTLKSVVPNLRSRKAQPQDVSR